MLSKTKFNCDNNIFKFLIILIFKLDLFLEAPPPLKPNKKYCDITGFEVNQQKKNI